MAKQHSKKIGLVKRQYSGNHHALIPGISLVNLLHYEIKRQQKMPVDYRIYDKKSDGKNKNKHFRQMLRIAKLRGMKPTAVVMDSWYSSLKNLKSIKDFGWVWVTLLRKNRKVNENVSLEMLSIPDEGLQIHLQWLWSDYCVQVSGKKRPH